MSALLTLDYWKAFFSLGSLLFVLWTASVVL